MVSAAIRRQDDVERADLVVVNRLRDLPAGAPVRPGPADDRERQWSEWLEVCDRRGPNLAQRPDLGQTGGQFGGHCVEQERAFVLKQHGALGKVLVVRGRHPQCGGAP